MTNSMGLHPWVSDSRRESRGGQQWLQVDAEHEQAGGSKQGPGSSHQVLGGSWRGEAAAEPSGICRLESDAKRGLDVTPKERSAGG